MSETTFTVTGMTCEHCVKAVADEVGQVAGVTDVDVDLASGRVRVVSDGAEPVPADAVYAAVREAGYEVTG
jgi:copper ion binding protein